MSKARRGKIFAVFFTLWVFGVLIGILWWSYHEDPVPVLPDWPSGIDEYAWAQWETEDPVMIGIDRDKGLVYFPGQKRAYKLERLDLGNWWIRRIPQPEAYEPDYGGLVS